MAGRVWSQECEAAGQGVIYSQETEMEAPAQHAFNLLFSWDPAQGMVPCKFRVDLHTSVSPSLETSSHSCVHRGLSPG